MGVAVQGAHCIFAGNLVSPLAPDITLWLTIRSMAVIIGTLYVGSSLTERPVLIKWNIAPLWRIPHRFPGGARLVSRYWRTRLYRRVRRLRYCAHLQCCVGEPAVCSQAEGMPSRVNSQG